MTIKPGDRFLCTKSFFDNGSFVPLYQEGRLYHCRKEGSITDEKGDSTHHWDVIEAEKYFKNNPITVKEVSVLKRQLENDILYLINKFEANTSISPLDISLSTMHKDSKTGVRTEVNQITVTVSII